jgi:hypothetical protein
MMVRCWQPWLCPSAPCRCAARHIADLLGSRAVSIGLVAAGVGFSRSAGLQCR